MTTTKIKTPPRRAGANSISLADTKRFPAIRTAFAGRGLGHLSLSAMLRIVMDEWIAAQGRS